MSIDDARSIARSRSGESLAEQIRRKGLTPITSVDELRADVWDSDHELDAFLSFFRLSRNADLSHP
ncbi:hypothetical protein [Jiangella mangrovi]|uniref:Uncharacterized protein n=1 Tax=Jiangella mangrovi TaxID=1524084 RepID=A0A7W9GSU6_9ACTN|nr:hypothetical protein [Jiangella mangrovi]MBB5789307.1 hypothetical protein [Jiangella mangrovi]